MSQALTEMTVTQFHDRLRAQKVQQLDIALICPMCGTVQSARDLIAAGAGADFDAVEKYLGFSCYGRWTHGKPPPREKGTQAGCNWTLGGFLPICDLLVITEDGKKQPSFMPATQEQAQLHAERHQIWRRDQSRNWPANSGPGWGYRGPCQECTTPFSGPATINVCHECWTTEKEGGPQS